MHQRLLILLTAVAVPGCIFPLVKHRYDLGTPTTSVIAVRPGLRVAIAPVTVEEAFDREELVVRDPDGELDAVETWRWQAIPSAMATRFALAHADATLPGAEITTSPSDAGYVLRAHILEMSTDRDASCDPVAVRMRVSMRLERGVYTRTPTTVFSDIVTRVVPVTDGEHSSIPATMGRALSAALDTALRVLAADAKRPAPPVGITLLAIDDENTGLAIVIGRAPDGTLATLQLERGRQPYRAYTITSFRAEQLDAHFALSGSDVASAALTLRDGIYMLAITRDAKHVDRYTIFDPAAATIANWIRSLEPPMGRVVRAEEEEVGG